MKDDRLEKEFEEYFSGVNISNDITADAKAEVRPRRKIMPKLVKFASVAASIVLVFAVSLTVILKSGFNAAPDGGEVSNNSSGNATDNGASGNSGGVGMSPGPGSSDGDEFGDAANRPDTPGDEPGENPGMSPGDEPGDEPGENPGNDPSSGDPTSPSPGTYTDSDLNKTEEDLSSLLSLHSSLSFLQGIADTDGVSVEYCTAGYMNGRLTLVTAEIERAGTDERATAFVEFTDGNLIYSGLEAYHDGNAYYFENVKYYLSQTAKVGGYDTKLFIPYGGVKYYFEIHSSDSNAFNFYLESVIK